MSEESSNEVSGYSWGGAGGGGSTSLTDGAGGECDVDRETVRDAFVDAAPRTTAEVATAVGASSEAVTDALAALETAGDLRRKEVGDADSTTLWYLPAATLRERETEGITEAGDDIDRAIARMSFPGASRMMRDWRRDAVRAVVEHLRAAGPTAAAGIRDALYPPHSAGYDDADVWWDCVRPRLLAVPGVAHENGEWKYDPDS